MDSNSTHQTTTTMGGDGCYVVGSCAPAIEPKQLNTVTA